MSSEITATDTAQLAREQDFHDARFADGMSRAAQEKYYRAVRDGRAIHEARIRDLARDADVLECGCATGDMSLSLAPIARSVAGIDISGVAIARATAGTADEHPRLRCGIATTGGLFGTVAVRHFGPFALGAVPFRRGAGPGRRSSPSHGPSTGWPSRCRRCGGRAGMP